MHVHYYFWIKWTCRSGYRAWLEIMWAFPMQVRILPSRLFCFCLSSNCLKDLYFSKRRNMLWTVEKCLDSKFRFVLNISQFLDTDHVMSATKQVYLKQLFMFLASCQRSTANVLLITFRAWHAVGHTGVVIKHERNKRKVESCCLCFWLL